MDDDNSPYLVDTPMIPLYELFELVDTYGCPEAAWDTIDEVS